MYNLYSPDNVFVGQFTSITLAEEAAKEFTNSYKAQGYYSTVIPTTNERVKISVEDLPNYMKIYSDDDTFHEITVMFIDDESVQENLIVKIGLDVVDEEDDKIFFYFENLDELVYWNLDLENKDFVINGCKPIKNII
jgi:hypothetical protein